jgi:hypothetical protein
MKRTMSWIAAAGFLLAAGNLQHRYLARLTKRYAMGEFNGVSWCCSKPSAAGSPGALRWFVSNKD